MFESWIQLNLALVRGDGGALVSARAVFAAISGAVASLRSEKKLACFFFMRKPPDLRLRFGLPQGVDPSAVTKDLLAPFAQLRQRGFVSAFFESIYEPEVRQFGGPRAMDAIHLWFDADTRAWLGQDALAAKGENQIDPAVISLAAINDLFARTLEDHGEIWDCWANLDDLIATKVVASPLERIGLSDIAPKASATEAEILAQYDTANLDLSTRLQQIWSDNQLTSGLRAILPFVAWFHYNRYGFAPETQARMSAGMRAAWDLKRELRGV